MFWFFSPYASQKGNAGRSLTSSTSPPVFFANWRKVTRSSAWTMLDFASFTRRCDAFFCKGSRRGSAYVATIKFRPLTFTSSCCTILE